MSNIVRAFVAAEIPPDLRHRAHQLIMRLSVTSARVRWVDPENLHWTLKFLGDVDLTDVPRICDAVSHAVADFPPFDVEAAGAGAFPNLQQPRTVWIGMGEGTSEMVALHRTLERALARIGFREEHRRFRPHITLGRVRGTEGVEELAALLEHERDFNSGLTTIDEVTVFSSELDRDGPTYTALAHAELRGDEDLPPLGSFEEDEPGDASGDEDEQ